MKGVGMCNALRRILWSDLTSLCPHELTVHVNTSCQTDEFLAHRIGLMPMRRVGNGDALTLDVSGPKRVTAANFVSVGLEPVHPNVEIIPLIQGQRLSVTVRVDEQRGSKHARYAPVSGVGMSVGKGGDCELTFDTIDGSLPDVRFEEALACLASRVDRALLALSAQPDTPPKSFC